MTAEATESQIDAVIAAAPALNPALENPLVLNAFITDMAQNIHSKAEICSRYCLTIAQMLDLVSRPGIAEQIRQRRAIFNSGESVEDKNRAYYGTMLLDAAPVLDKIVHDPTANMGTKLDALTLMAKNAGVYSSGGPKGGPGQTSGGATFAVNINFSGGRTKSLGAVIDAGPVTAIETSTVVLTIDEDAYVETSDDDA